METKMTDAARAALLLRLLIVSEKVANEALAELAETRARSPAPKEGNYHAKDHNRRNTIHYLK